MMKTTNEEVHNKRSLTKGIIAIACACALALVGVYAYLTATDQVKNIFGFTDKLDIEVVEPNWDPDNAQNLLPTQSVTKDPALHNPNKVDVYVFADVVIPQKDIVTANADGTLNASAVVDLFSYELNDGWTLKDTIVGDDGAVTYRYVYNDVVPAGETSGSIFDEVAIVNYVNEQFNTEELAQQIVINGYGAQAVGFESVDAAYASYFANVGVDQRQAFAVYSADDNSLNFYKRSSVPAAGESFESKVVTEVYTGIQTDSYSSSTIPWKDHRSSMMSVTVVDEGIAPVSTAYWFSEFTNCASIDMAKLDTSRVTDMSYMFIGCESLTTLNVSGFDTSNVTDMSCMFLVCSQLTTLDLSGWNTSQVTDMSYMFSDCESLTTLNVSGFDTSNVTDMSCMFNNCTSLAAIEGISNWDTSQVTNMASMFSDCTSLTTLNVSGFDTSRVTMMSGMFSDCESLTTLNVSGFDTSNVTDMSNVFWRCSVLTTLDLSGWDTSRVTKMSDMFGGCRTLTTLDLSGWNTSQVTTMSGMFIACPSLVTIYVGDGWSTGAVTNSGYMFSDCTALIGGNGTTYDSSHTDPSFARIDGLNGQPGYFTAK